MTRDAADALRACAPMIRGLAHRFALSMPDRAVDVDDLRQEAGMAILHAVTTCPEDAGAVDFQRYARRCAINRLHDVVRRSRLRRSTSSIDAPHGDDGTTMLDTLGNEPDADAIAALSGMAARLNERELVVLAGLRAGDTYQEIGARLGVHEQEVGKIARGLRRYLVDGGAPPERPGVRMFEHDGRTMTLREWALERGIVYRTLANRIAVGWPFERAIGAVPRAA